MGLFAAVKKDYAWVSNRLTMAVTKGPGGVAMLILSHPAWIERAMALLLKITWKATARRALLSPSQIYLPEAMGP